MAYFERGWEFPKGTPDLVCAICKKEVVKRRLNAKGWPEFSMVQKVEENFEFHFIGDTVKVTNLWWCGSEECYNFIVLQNI